MKILRKHKFLTYILVTVLSLSLLTGCAADVNTSPESTAASDRIEIPESTSRSETEASTETEASSSSDAEVSPSEEPMITDTTPYGLHGALYVEDGKLKDASGENFQLYGMSSHGIGWYPQYICKETFQYLNEEYGTNCVRLAMYTAENAGYCTGGDQNYLKNLVCSGVDYATELGMYAIVDWHILSDRTPQTYKEEAKKFFAEISEKYKDRDNVIYEICNEPNNTDWNSVKTYAEEVIPVIRANDPNAVIIVGTPTWSQDLECPLNDPVNEDNLLYALHFYAATHKDDLRNRAQQCIDKGLPVFVSEFGMCDASGNGGNDFDSTQKWLDMINQNDLSYMCWALGSKDEACCIIRPNNDKLSEWTDDELNESGKWILKHFKSKTNP